MKCRDDLGLFWRRVNSLPVVVVVATTKSEGEKFRFKSSSSRLRTPHLRLLLPKHARRSCNVAATTHGNSDAAISKKSSSKELKIGPPSTEGQGTQFRKKFRRRVLVVVPVEVLDQSRAPPGPGCALCQSSSKVHRKTACSTLKSHLSTMRRDRGVGTKKEHDADRDHGSRNDLDVGSCREYRVLEPRRIGSIL